MKRLISKLLIVLCISCFLCSTFAYKTMAVGNSLDEADVQYLSDNGFKIVADNSLMILYANETNGEFAVVDKRNYFIWYSNPKDREDDELAQGIVKMELFSQLNVIFTDYSSDQLKMKNNYTGSIRKDEVKFEAIKDGFRVTYNFPGEDGFSIPIEITLGKNFLSVEIDTTKITETNNFIYSMDLLPYFGAGNSTDQGYIFVPDGSGALINFNSNKLNIETYREAIYGRDNTFAANQNPVKRQEIKLPVFGIKNGDNAFLAVVDKGESQGTITANVSGLRSSYNNVYTTFDIRKFDSFTVGQGGHSVKNTRLFEKGDPRIGSCKIKYYFLNGADADYSGMAKTYRNYLVDEKGLTPNTDIKPQMYLQLYGAVRKRKSILGIPFNLVQPLTTYKDTINILEELKENNVKDVVVDYHDWFSDSIDNKIATNASVIGKLGGKKSFTKLVDYSKDNNIKLFPQVDFIRIIKGRLNHLKAFNQAKTIGTIPASEFQYKLSTYFKDLSKPVYSLIAPNNLNKVVSKFNKSYGKYEVGGIGLDSISSMVYSDFTKSRMSTRQETEETWVDTLELMKKEIGSVKASAPNAYALPYLDYIFDVPSSSSNYYITDETIPFYQMVIRGIVPYTIEAFNFSADKDMQLLKAIETGANPYYRWIGEDPSKLKETKYEGLYGADYEAWMDSAVADFKVIEKLHLKIKNSKIDKHEKLAEGVYKTTYSNGVNVFVNYSTVEYWIGNTIVAPRNYLIMEGGN
jgi:hypothetical protein